MRQSLSSGSAPPNSWEVPPQVVILRSAATKDLPATLFPLEDLRSEAPHGKEGCVARIREGDRLMAARAPLGTFSIGGGGVLRRCAPQDDNGGRRIFPTDAMNGQPRFGGRPGGGLPQREMGRTVSLFYSLFFFGI